MSWFEQNKHKSNLQIAEETERAVLNSRYQPEKHMEIIRIAESQGIGQDMVRYIAGQTRAAKTGDDMNTCTANLDWIMKAVGQVRPDLEADMRKNPGWTAHRLLYALDLIDGDI